jgi:glycosyltransferase involved in cell wall biosynthesis
MNFKISVIIPTHNRRELLKKCLESLERQSVSPDVFEVVVVVDGSSDGTAEFLGQYRPPYAFKFLVRENQGIAAARNLGNRHAASDSILCLDDDAIAAPRLIEEHLRSLAEHPGSLIQGRQEIHSSIIKTPYCRYQDNRLRAFFRHADSRGGCLDGLDVAGGNMSFARELAEKAGGFNEKLKKNVDGDFFYRLELLGARVFYNREALAYLTHFKDFEQSLGDEAYLYGRTYVLTQREFPETIWKHSPLFYDGKSWLRNALRKCLFRAAPGEWHYPRLERLLRKAPEIFAPLGIEAVLAASYRLAQDYFFWKGAHAESGGSLRRFCPRGIPILCYHNVSDMKRERFGLYILPVEKFARQMRWLKQSGYQPITLDALSAYLERGEEIPERAVVITFDDGYRALKDTAAPLLAQLGFHHVYFINSGKLGKTADWVEAAPDLEILRAEEVREMADRYDGLTDFQPHGRTHLSLAGQDAETIRREVGDCIAELDVLLNRPARYLAYAYGEYDEEALRTVAAMSLRCAFTVDQGLCRPGQNPRRLPRVEIFANDGFLDFVCKVKFGWSPIARLRTFLKRLYKKSIATVRSRL